MTAKLVCRIRGIAVCGTPEEQVRQALLGHLIGPVGCPTSLIAVEVPLRALVSCSGVAVPRRRLDIVCFSNRQGSLNPLLIIECKASRPSTEAIHQLNGYNFFVRAPALALAWPGHVFLFLHGKRVFEGEPSLLPTYDSLQAEADRDRPAAPGAP